MKDSSLNSSHSNNDDDWDQLLSDLLHYCLLGLSRVQLREQTRTPKNEGEIRLSLNTISFFQNYLVDEYSQSFSEILSPLNVELDFTKEVTSLIKGSILNFGQQNQLILILEKSLKLYRSTPQDQLNPFITLTDKIDTKEIAQILKQFRHLVDDSGEVNFDNHPELKELGIKLQEVEEKSRKEINETMRKKDFQDALQFNNYDVLNDHFVLPIRTDSYKSHLGYIIDRSETGQTLYVEPPELRDLAIQRLSLINKIREIIYQLERKLCQNLSAHHELLSSCLFSLIRFDEFLAKARFCYRYQLNRPEISSDKGFEFQGLFHPLIKNPIRNHLVLPPEKKGIVISGPNTGGKSALLKAVHISYQLLRQGLFLPSSHAKIFLYEKVFFSQDDLQSIHSGLSSFSGEVTRYFEIIETLGSSNLILIDEIFNSTSSDEASALAYSLFQKISKISDSHLFITTHHQYLKSLVDQDHDYLSGSVGFDQDKMAPTYRFHQGIPGSSMALEIFQKVLDTHPYQEDISKRARELLSGKHVEYDSLIGKLNQKRAQLDKKSDELEKKEKDLQSKEASLEGLFQLKLNDEITKAGHEFNKTVEKARSLLNKVQMGELHKKKKLEDEIHKLGKVFRTEEKDETNSHKKCLLPHQLKIGLTYHNTFLRSDVQLVSIDWRKKTAVVTKGSLNIQVRLDTFLPTTQKVSSFQDIKISVDRSSPSLFSIDARGMRLEEFQNKVELALADLLSGQQRSLSIIHGHGNGVLKSWLRNYISQSVHYTWTVPETGNDGETEVRLKPD